MNILKYLFAFLFFASSISLFSQDDDLMSMLEDEVEEEPMEVAYTFKSTRIINSHTIERMTTRQLDFRVNHRFGEINKGYENFWGLDQAYISLDFGYGINDWLMAGLRRSTENKTIDGSLKFTILRQTKGTKTIPVALSYYSNVAVDGREGKRDFLDSDSAYSFNYRLAFTNQLLIARKFNETLSLQLMPTYVHRNLVEHYEDNDIFSVGIGGRAKITRRVSLTFEYFWCSHTTSYSDKYEVKNSKYYDPLSIGFDIETGGHVFQLFFSNTRIMEESGFISRTKTNPLQGDLFFGFNISRVFAIGKPKH